MNSNNKEDQLRYRRLMSNNLKLSKHYKKRYKERVSKSSKNALRFAMDAYALGDDINSISNKKTRQRFITGELFGSECRIYRGFVCWFNENIVVTVYPVSFLK